MRRYKSADKPSIFDVRSLCPVGSSDAEVAELLADFFNRISSEFSALEPADIPVTFDRHLPLLQPWDVAARIKKFKKPKSQIPGDIPPDLVTKFSDQLAVPLTYIYNQVLNTLEWPELWKSETVTIIPKNN